MVLNDPLLSALSKTGLSQTLKSYFCFDRSIQVAENLDQDLKRLPPERRLLLRSDHAGVVAPLEPALSNT